MDGRSPYCLARPLPPGGEPRNDEVISVLGGGLEAGRLQIQWSTVPAASRRTKDKTARLLPEEAC